MKNPAIIVLLAALPIAAACSHLPSFPGQKSADRKAVAKTVAATVARSPRERVSLAIELLSAGREDEARAELGAALGQSPRDRIALLLTDQIEKGAAAFPGAVSEDYVVKTGDTMSDLAGRYLGDPMLFYSLSRFNGLAAPNALAVGKTLRIPLLQQASNTAAKPLAPASAPAVEPLAGAQPAARASVDAIKANAIRLRALEKLNTGHVVEAVTLLKEAQTLDASNVAIGRDLERALRIQASLAAG